MIRINEEVETFLQREIANSDKWISFKYILELKTMKQWLFIILSIFLLFTRSKQPARSHLNR